MTGSGKEVLFVSHQATRTGAPLVLLRLLEWIKGHTDLQFDLLLLTNGPLRRAFEEVSNVTSFEDRFGASILSVAERELLKIGKPKLSRAVTRAIRLHLRSLRDYPVVYLNSAVSLPVLRHIPGHIGRVIAHVHELSTGMQFAVPPPLRRPDGERSLLDRVDRFIAAADCVKEALVNEYVIAGERVAVHHEFVDVQAVDSAASASAPEEIRTQLGIPPEAAVVVACGSLEWRKGSDLFIQLGRLLAAVPRGRPVHLVWVGGESDGPALWPINHDVVHAGVAGHVHFVPNTEHRFDYFRLADVFVLTSREDPFPLVCLEASLLGLPVISFDSGGVREFLPKQCIVRYLDLMSMAQAIEDVLADGDAWRRVSNEAAVRVRNDYDVKVRAPGIYAEIESMLQAHA